MSVTIHSPRPVVATPLKGDSLSPEQRRRLKEFSAKFIQYLPTFDVNVLRQHFLFYKATYRVFSSIDQPYVVKDEVKDCKAPTPATRVFLTKAVHRFEVWLKLAVNLRSSDTPLESHEIPPLDVLIILHAYRLSPWIYDEDLTLRFPQMAKIGDFPLDHIAKKVDAITAEYQPSSEQVATWEKMTGLPFDVFAMDNTVSIACPACSNSFSVPWTGGPVACDGGTGFAETGFTTHCFKCSLNINHDTLATAKFVRDLIACRDTENNVLAGTLVDGNGSTHLESAKKITAEVIKTLGDPHADLGKQLSWSMTTVASRISDDPESQIRKSEVATLLRPYQQSSPFSTDLVYKAIIQAEFAARSKSKGFFELSFLQQEDNTWLAGAVKAYRLFIKLVLMPHMPKVYPTYAVDIVWHTHQLGSQYKKQMLDMLGVFIDHRSHDEIAPTFGKCDRSLSNMHRYLRLSGVAAFEAARDAWANTLYTLGLPPLEAIIGLKKGSSPVACNVSASQALKEDSILAIKFFDETDSFEEAPTQFPSVLELKEVLAE